jgi:hypothetical protein
MNISDMYSTNDEHASLPAADLGLLFATFAAIVFAGCSFFRSTGCPAIKLADQACDVFVVERPDGTRYRVTREELEAAGRRTEAALNGASDAGKSVVPVTDGGTTE